MLIMWETYATTGGYMIITAKFSPCRKYRYTLTRVWKEEKDIVCFVGLNPSTATETKDDPTIRRCIRFVRSWGYGGLIMLNLFAYRSTDPKKLNHVQSPIGPDNDFHIMESSRLALFTVLAYGNTGGMGYRSNEVLKIIKKPYCLGITKKGYPRHPLYVKANTRPIPFNYVGQ